MTILEGYFIVNIMNYAEIYKNLESLCREAGEIALKYQDNLEVERKNDKEEILAVVTVADKEIDTFLKESLTSRYQDIAWLSEETEDDASRLEKEYVWVVDPIDGTKSYIDNTGEYAISAALVKNGVPIMGVVYNPAKNDLVGGYRGGGVWWNGEQITPQFSTKLQGSTCLVSCNETRKGLWEPFKDTLTLKNVHSIAYKLAIVASGRGDAMATLKGKSEWDVAAGHFLCVEAGLTVTDLQGRPITYNNKCVEVPGLIAAPTGWHKELQSLLNQKKESMAS